jgi:hypothetical protein
LELLPASAPYYLTNGTSACTPSYPCWYNSTIAVYQFALFQCMTVGHRFTVHVPARLLAVVPALPLTRWMAVLLRLRYSWPAASKALVESHLQLVNRNAHKAKKESVRSVQQTSWHVQDRKWMLPKVFIVPMGRTLILCMHTRGNRYQYGLRKRATFSKCLNTSKSAGYHYAQGVKFPTKRYETRDQSWGVAELIQSLQSKPSVKRATARL